MATEAEIKAYLSDGSLKPENEASQRHVTFTCDHCGSTAVELWAFVTWSKVRQKWIVRDIDWDRDAYCNDCECDTTVSEIGT